MNNPRAHVPVTQQTVQKCHNNQCHQKRESLTRTRIFRFAYTSICMQAFQKFLQGVFDMAVMNGMAFERCHEVMKALADSWENMKSIPARCGIEEGFEDCIEVR